MRIDGKHMRDEMKAKLKKEFALLSFTPRLVIVVVGENPVVRGFVNLKKKFAKDVGVDTMLIECVEDITQGALSQKIEKLNTDDRVHGIIIQLPLPAHLDTDAVVNMIAPSKDVDVLGAHAIEDFKTSDTVMVPPVIGAIREIVRSMHIVISGKNVLIVGHGRLVGMPATIWFEKEGGLVTIVDRPSPNLGDLAQKADIIVCGAGVPGLIKPEMLKSGVMIFDAGASEEGGVVVGDALPQCEELADVFTPVPGGIGPVTVAMIFENLKNIVKTG